MKYLTILLAGLCATLTSFAQEKHFPPPDPVEDAKNARAIELIELARQRLRANDEPVALTLLQEASAVEATMRAYHARSKYALARLFVKQNRIGDALECYKSTFIWNSKANYGSIQRGDLASRGGGIDAAMEYAILLAQGGRAEDAKAMYYFALRSHTLGQLSRSQEPAPFVVVFDPEPEGIYWEYTPQRLEAAALMVLVMLSDGKTDFATNSTTTDRDRLERIRTLAPDWFYPVLYMASQKNLDSPIRAQLTAEAQALAKPGLERQLMEQYNRDFAELLVINEQNDTPGATDSRPMTEGAERRKRMQCLRPNEQILRRLSIERPGG